MGRVLPGRGVGVVRRHDYHQGSRAGDAMNFLHGAYDGLDVFDHVRHANVIEGVRGEGIGEPVQIVDHVHPFQWHHIQTDASGKLETAATNVKALSAQNRYLPGSPTASEGPLPRSRQRNCSRSARRVAPPLMSYTEAKPEVVRRRFP